MRLAVFHSVSRITRKSNEPPSLKLGIMIGHTS